MVRESIIFLFSAFLLLTNTAPSPSNEKMADSFGLKLGEAINSDNYILEQREVKTLRDSKFFLLIPKRLDKLRDAHYYLNELHEDKFIGKYFTFVPQKKNEYFDRYIALVTPKTNTVYEIRASKTFNKPDYTPYECKVMLDDLSVILKENYGDSYNVFSTDEEERIQTAFISSDHKRGFVLECLQAVPLILQLRYLDADIMHLNEKEKLNME
jgi:hypothetical protein